MNASRFRRGATAVLLVAAVLAGSALSAPVTKAQTAETVHVSNLGQANSGATGDFEYFANSFDTGGTTVEVFRLQSVVLHLHSSSGTMRIYTYSDGVPGAQVGGDLVKQGSATSGQVTFNAPSSGITLAGDTTYMVRLHDTSGADHKVRWTVSDNEDAGSASGWSIGGAFRYSNNGTAWNASTDSLRLRINATGPFFSDELRSQYAWCYSRMSEADCSEAIQRWESEVERVNRVQITERVILQGNITDWITALVCPRTHAIRVATTTGVVCEQSYWPVGPLGGGPEIAPASVKEDTWDGSPRDCHPQSRGYANLEGAPVRPHGLRTGCHTHDGNAHHEHTILTH